MSLFLPQLSFSYNPAFCFNMGKKLWKNISFSSTCFCYYRKYPNNDNKICSQSFSFCFQQHFHDWFYALRWNPDLSKLEWALVLFNFNYIRDLTNRCKLFSIPATEYASFSHQARRLLNLLDLISNFSKYDFKIGTICIFFFSSHVFTALEFDSNHFGILIWKVKKPRDHNKIKPPIGKVFQKYKPIRYYFVMYRKYLTCSFVNKVYDNYNKVTYLQRNTKWYNLQTTL